METSAKIRQKPGPVPSPETKKYTVLIPPVLGDWGKLQPGGLSDLMRRLLLAQRNKVEGKA